MSSFENCKLKIGDVVRVIGDDVLSNLGKVGTVIGVEDRDKPFEVEFSGGEMSRYYSEDELRKLIPINQVNTTNNLPKNTDQTDNNGAKQFKSDGGSSDYYKQQIPKKLLEHWNETGVVEARHVIRLFLGNDFTQGNLFKAGVRVVSSRNGGGKAGTTIEYDLNKQYFFAEDEKEWEDFLS